LFHRQTALSVCSALPRHRALLAAHRHSGAQHVSPQKYPNSRHYSLFAGETEPATKTQATLARLESEANAAPEDVEKQLALFKELVVSGAERAVVTRWETAVQSVSRTFLRRGDSTQDVKDIVLMAPCSLYFDRTRNRHCSHRKKHSISTYCHSQERARRGISWKPSDNATCYWGVLPPLHLDLRPWRQRLRDLPRVQISQKLHLRLELTLHRAGSGAA
jgi:hypothetical protein